jgi:hypothetical protein
MLPIGAMTQVSYSDGFKILEHIAVNSDPRITQSEPDFTIFDMVNLTVKAIFYFKRY